MPRRSTSLDPTSPKLRYAVISVGTNSCRLLIAERSDDGALRPDYHETRGTRLGEDVQRSRMLRTDAMDRTLAAVRDYAALSRGVDKLFGIGTSALRDAANRNDFERRFAALTGVQLDLLSGDDEAASSFEGAVCGLKAAGRSVPAALTVVDVGGGSTEFATRADNAVEPLVGSLQLGAVRLTEEWLKGDPPSAADVERSRQLIRAQLLSLPPDVRAKSALVAVGGTANTAARMLQAMPEPSASGVAEIAAADLASLLKMTLAIPVRERVRLRGLPAQRADIFPAGLLIIDEIIHSAGATVLVVCESDLLLGYVSRHT